MTESEAIEIVRKEKAYMDSHAGRAQSEAFQIAINALEKQIQRKPIDKSKNPKDWHVMACPRCEHTFWNSGQFVHYQPKFCNYCGQKLDWSDKE